MKAFQINSTDPKAVMECLEAHGLCVIPNYLSDNELQALNDEYDQILVTGDTPYARVKPYSNGQCVIITREEMSDGALPATSEVFNHPFMQEMTDAYLGEGAMLNHEIFVVKDVVGTKHHANDLHFDVVATFKFFLYLTDTTAENGAFSCVPGSHLKTKAIRAKMGDKISYENREISRELPVEESDVVPIEGNAGTLIIFTTETFHRAGTVTNGERRVMRGHCRRPEFFNNPKKRSFVQKVKARLGAIISN